MLLVVVVLMLKAALDQAWRAIRTSTTSDKSALAKSAKAAIV
jgi:hypothetical protein